MIRAWRIFKSRYSENALDGEGPRLYGGRWSSPGTRIVYASQNLSLAVLEVLVHLQDPKLLASYVYLELSLPEETIDVFDRSALSPSWRSSPAPPETQRAGDTWARQGRRLVLRVPSVVIPAEDNFLINPAHPDFPRVAVTGPLPVDPDPRLFAP